jgi:glycosyltransferase involved in cell wall biosynthesis
VSFLKVLFLAGNLNHAGGTERVGTLIANKLYEIGYDVTLASIYGGDKPFFPQATGVKSISISTAAGRTLYKTPKIIYKIRKLLYSEKFDAIVTIESMSVLFTLPASFCLPVKNVCWEHFNFKSDLGKVGRRIARQLAARFCDSVVTLTEKDKKYWLDNTKHKSQINAIANPCPFSTQPLFESQQSKVVLAVGRLTFQKGFDLLLQAWVNVNKACPDWKLKIVGDGEDKTILNRFIEDNQLVENVELVGKTDYIQEFYKNAEIFCLSSRFEGFPMVLLETLSFGLPVVSYDCDTGPEEVLSGTGSLLVEPSNTDALALSLIKLINDEKSREEISIKSRIKASDYQIDAIIKHWDELLVKL